MQLLDEDVIGESYWWSGASDSGRGQCSGTEEHSLTPVDDFVLDAGYPRDLTYNNYLCFLNTHDYMSIDCHIQLFISNTI